MPLQIKDEVFAIPGEGSEPNVSGREITNIEDALGLDGLSLLGLLASEDALHPNPKYTRSKAIYAVAWICLTRAGKIVSFDNVLDSYTIADFKFLGDDPKKSETAAN